VQPHLSARVLTGAHEARSQQHVQSNLSVSTGWTLAGACYGLDAVQIRDPGKVGIRKSGNLGIWESPVAQHNIP